MTAALRSWSEDSRYSCFPNGRDGIIAVKINRQYSMEARQLTDAVSTEEYALGTIRLDQLFGPEDGREVEAVFADDNAVICEDENGVISNLDAIWLCFTDGTFAEYAFLDGNVVRYGSGTYQFHDTGDFRILTDEENYGTIMLAWEEPLGGFAGKSLTFNLGTIGSACLYGKLAAGQIPELPAKAGRAIARVIIVKSKKRTLPTCKWNHDSTALRFSAVSLPAWAKTQSRAAAQERMVEKAARRR